MVYVQLGSLETGAWSDNTGLFSGQNIQNSWDSHSPVAQSFGGSMGDHNLDLCFFSIMRARAYLGQPINDADYKSNYGRYTMR